MGKRPGPSEEELEFIFKKFLNNLPDQEILNEMEDTTFPKRNLRYLRERRRHFYAAKKVLQIQLEKEIDPIIVQREKDHFDHLADITQGLLSGNLDNVTAKSTKAGDQFDIFEYIFWEGGLRQGITRKQLSDMMERNVELYYEQPNDTYDLDYFLHHLIAEYPEVESKGFNNFVKENPYELVDILRLLARRKTFKGTCPVCKDW